MASGQLCAQAPAPAPSILIDELVAHAGHYRATLPSLTADEAIDSEASLLFFKDRALTTGTFRAIRSSAGGPLDESRQLAVYNGKPVAPGKHVSLPITLFGGFGRFQELFLAPANRVCFDFILLSSGPAGSDARNIRIAVAGMPDARRPPACPDAFASITGRVDLDPATHQILHFERTVPAEVAAATHLAPFASVDCAPTLVGSDTYWLPTLVVGLIQNGRVKGRFTARYSNYHRYTASMTLLPDISPVSPQHPPQPATPILAPPVSTPAPPDPIVMRRP